MSEVKTSGREGQGNGAALVVVLLLMFLGLPLVYCLSLGPAIWLVRSAGVDSTIFEYLYAPLEWVHRNVDVVRPLLDWYVGLWDN